MRKVPELLSPAGDMDCLRAAVLYGADAVYLGGKALGMRASSGNFSSRELKDAVDYCHQHGVSVYLTCNTLPTNAEADELPDFLLEAARAGVDAFIAADIGVLMLARRLAPEVPVHISTQAGVTNYRTAAELHQLGASRVVLARELSLEDIAALREKTPPALELEAFVHGAMCVSFSGRCLLSQYLTGRDANRGNCAQPCRWRYHLMEEKRPGQFFPVLEEEEGSYILNAKDLSMLPHLDLLARAGVNSFKVEGRAKSPYYVATITGAYRQGVDLLAADPENYHPPAWLLEETKKVGYREYCSGFYLPGEPPGQYYQGTGRRQDWEVAATVEAWEDGWLLCTQRNHFRLGETLEILYPAGRPDPLVVEALLDAEGNPLDAARHPMMGLRIPSAKPYPAGSMLRRKTGKWDAPVG